MSSTARAFRAASVVARPDRLVAALKIAGLVHLGWDPATQVLTPDPAHRLLGYAICACGNEADRSAGLCAACSQRLRGHGGGRRQQRQDGMCAVCRVPPACRPAAVHGLCLSCNRLRSVQGQSVENFIAGDERFGPAEPRPGFGACAVVSCERLASHAAGMCHPHDKAWRQAGRPQLEEFGRTAAPVRGDRQGRVVLRGLPERVITEVLYGIQASVAEGRIMKPKELRTAVDHMRRLGVGSVTAAAERGSSKLWNELTGADAPDGEKFAEMMSLTKGDYVIERWWKYGQPAIDKIAAVITSSPEQFGDLLGSIVKLHGDRVAVGFEGFPIGVVAFDAIRLNVVLENNVQG